MDPIWKEMLDAANAVRGKRRISGYVDVGGVAAAVESASGRIYTGICVDTCCTLGICAERSALFQMLTAGDDEVRRVVAVGRHGRPIPPCGACREFLVQLMPQKYADIEILLGGEEPRIVLLGSLTPEWWIEPPAKNKR